MRLTIEEHPEAIKRYGHIRPAPRWRARSCGSRLSGANHTCTRAEHHRGPHVAHARFGKVVAAWDSAAVARAPGEAAHAGSAHRERRDRPARRPVGLPTRTPAGLLERLGRRIVRVVTSVEELALLILFIAFVWFAIDWMRMIMG
jgi:hypothetical protein